MAKKKVLQSSVSKEISLSLVMAMCFLGIVIFFVGLQRWEGVLVKDRTFDEGVYRQLGFQLIEDPLNYSLAEYYKDMKSEGDDRRVDYLAAPLFKHPPLFSYILSFAFRLFGSNAQVGAAVSMGFGLLTIVLVFMIGSSVFNIRSGLLAALIVAVDPINWLCSQKIWIDATYVFFFYLGVYLLVLGIKKNEKFYIASGLAFGLSFLSKYFAFLPFSGVLLYLFFAAGKLPARKWLAGFLAACALPLLPWIFWNYRVYGSDIFLSMIRSQMHTSSDTKGQHDLVAYVSLALLFLLIPGIFFIVRFFLSRSPESLAGYFKNALKLRWVPPILMIILFFGFLWMTVVVIHWKMMLPTVWPNLTQEMNVFYKEPIWFYLSRLIELAPIYLLAFLSPFFFKRWNEYHVLLLLVSLTTLLFFSFFRCFETRYIYAAIPAMALLAGESISFLWDFLRKGTWTVWKCVGILIICFALYAAGKTYWLDLNLVNLKDVWCQL